MGLIVEVGVAAAFALSNSPWQKKDTQFPYLYVEKSIAEDFFVSALNSARTNAKRIDMVDPKTALWRVSGGYRYAFENQTFTIEIGHQSEHDVGAKDSFSESYNFASVKYRIEYK